MENVTRRARFSNTLRVEEFLRMEARGVNVGNAVQLSSNWTATNTSSSGNAANKPTTMNIRT